MSKKLTMAIIAIVLAVVVIGVAVYYVSSNNDSKDGYTLSFESNGGTEVSPITFDEKTSVAAPPNPTKTVAELLGWYSDEDLTAPFEFDKLPSGNSKIFAKWAEYMDLDDDDWNEIENNPGTTPWNLGNEQMDSIAVRGSDILAMEDYLETVMLTVSNGFVLLDLEDLCENNNITSNSVFKFSITVGNKSALSSEESDIIGDRPLYNVIFTINDKAVLDPDDFITLYLNYTLKDGEIASKLQVYSLLNGVTESVDTDYSTEGNFVECDAEYSSYYIIAYGSLLWPDLFGIGIPHASEQIDNYAGTNLFDFFNTEDSDDIPSDLLKYIDVSNLNWELRSVSIDDYSKTQFENYIKSLESNGFKQYTFSEDISTSTNTWIGIKSVGGVNYLIVVDLDDSDLRSYSGQDGFSPFYQSDDSDLSIVLLNFDPLKELGISITKSESSSETWIDNLAGFTIPAPYANSGFKNLAEIEFSGSSLSALLDKIIITDNMSNEDRKSFESFLKGLNNIKCKMGYINVVDKDGRNLTYDAVWQEVNNIQKQNGLKLISATVDDGHYNSPVILAKTLEVANGQFTFEDLVIITFDGIEDDDLLSNNPEMSIFVVDASISMNLNDISIPGFQLNNLQFNEPWVENFAGFQFPEPYANAVIDYCMDMNIDIGELLNLLNTAFPDPNMITEEILVIKEAMGMYKDLSGSIGAISFTSSDFNFEAANKFVQNIVEANGLILANSEVDDEDGAVWSMFRSIQPSASGTSVTMEDMITVAWVPYELGGEYMYTVQISSIDAKFTISM